MSNYLFFIILLKFTITIVGIHPCVYNDGDCSDLCVLSPSQDFRCLCPAGRRLKADNKTCENGKNVFII